MSYKIGLDISGGDFAPSEIIKGAMLARNQLHEDIVLIGVKEEIERQLALNKFPASEFSVVHAPEKIEMAEPPATSVRRKRNSSITIAAQLLKEKKIDAFVSCGNTGAVVCASTLKLGLIEGVERPGIGLMMPSRTGISLVIDVGANIDCKPMHLFQYGIMASVYYRAVLGKENPTVGLLNIGEEASKGSGLIKHVHKLFSSSSLNFIGNVEAKDIFSGKCDCIVCDGLIGNIALKVAEGSAEAIGRFLIETMTKGFLGKIGILLAKNNLRKFKRFMDYAEYGGAPLLGIDGIVIIGHGRSNALAVKNAIRVACNELSHDLNARIKRRVNEICQDSGIRQILAG
ncbi:MAG: phosphate acyltransferase PlsX [Candidatus Omnitrophica bacterium]|nr:phosphate acyltransferase PlsX [Candidatus Omnitrophota bacterium]MDD5429808.1 phosphate acyltransferase PlsX [Candidatus Omnitrophota bacterium]